MVVASTSGSSLGTTTMRSSLKKVLQAVTLLSLVAYMTQVIRQHAYNTTDNNTVISRSNSNNINNNNNNNAAAAERNSLPPEALAASANRTAAAALAQNSVNFYLNDNKNTNSKVTQLSDIFISVKTTKSFHDKRLDAILKTWFVLARDQTWFFTDGEDEVYQQRTGGRLINTNCSSTHNRKALCCKMSVEYDKFLESNKKWFCHFDDDNYVNVPRLVALLRKYVSTEDWYLGKPSIRMPLRVMNRDNPQGPKISFWFATGGAGFCVSRALALKMMPIASGGKFISVGDKIRLPDDVTMGYIIEHVLHKNLTVIQEFHSHLEPMKFIRPETYSDQITFSYSRYGKDLNVVSIEGFDPRIDPTRFLSLHCYLFPSFSFCPR